MGKIYYIIGKSSSGKDTIFKQLLAKKDLNLKNIVSYTTRPIRNGEQDGVEYYFVNEKVIEEARNNKKLIELRSYNTCHGIWKYFTLEDHQINLQNENYLMIGTLESFIHIRDYFGREAVLPVLIELDDGERLQRALERERAQEIPKYEEMCRRFLADSEDFSERKIVEAGIEKRFYNDNLDRCLDQIKEYIKHN